MSYDKLSQLNLTYSTYIFFAATVLLANARNYNEHLFLSQVCNVMGQAIQYDHPTFKKRPPLFYAKTGKDPKFNVLSQKISQWEQSPACADDDFQRYGGAHYNVMSQRVRPCYSMPPLKRCDCREFTVLGQRMKCEVSHPCKPKPPCKGMQTFYWANIGYTDKAMLSLSLHY